MIPSDHFVRFYNEVFKFLDKQNGLEDFYKEISRHQEFHCLKLFQEKGLRGVYEYYLKIRKEENCDMEMVLSEHEFYSHQRKCPSLSKAIDNDAGVCAKYCLHCPGWIMPLYAKAGLYKIYDLMDLKIPQCRGWLFDDLNLARKRYKELSLENPGCHFLINFQLETNSDSPDAAKIRNIE